MGSNMANEEAYVGNLVRKFYIFCLLAGREKGELVMKKSIYKITNLINGKHILDRQTIFCGELRNTRGKEIKKRVRRFYITLSINTA